MTDATMATPSTTLYSQTPTDDRGNFHYQGDLHRAGEPLPDLSRRIERHLALILPDSRFVLRSETFAGGRKITAELLDHPADLTPEDERRAFEVTVRDQIERFGFTRSNFYQDSGIVTPTCSRTIDASAASGNCTRATCMSGGCVTAGASSTCRPNGTGGMGHATTISTRVSARCGSASDGSRPLPLPYRRWAADMAVSTGPVSRR